MILRDLLRFSPAIIIPETGFGRRTTISDFEIVPVGGIHCRAAYRAFEVGGRELFNVRARVFLYGLHGRKFTEKISSLQPDFPPRPTLLYQYLVRQHAIPRPIIQP